MISEETVTIPRISKGIGQNACGLMPLVSVVIPTYNYGRFIGDAVESVLSQTYHNLELIVVDDGSTDDTEERLKAYAGRLTYIRQVNAGVGAARNNGIANSNGQFIGLLDADDGWHSRHLEMVMNAFATQPQLAMVSTRTFAGEECHWKELDESKHGTTDVPIEALLTRHPVAPSAVVIRREFLDRSGGFDTSLKSVEDRDMWVRIAALGGRVGYIGLPLVWLRLHGSSMSSPANALKMEYWDRYVLNRAFEKSPLKDRWHLRRETLSIAACTAAISHREAGAPLRAWLSVLRALWMWPLPYCSGAATGVGQLQWRLLGSLVKAQLRSAFSTRSRKLRSAPE